MRDLLIACIVFGSLPVILKRPFWGILMLAWLGYMNAHRLCYGFMLSMPVVQIVAIVTLAGMLASKEVKRMIWSREIVMLVIFIVWMSITTTQAFYFELASEQYIKVIKIQILTFMTLLMLNSRQRVHLFIWAIVLSLGFYGIKGGIFTILNGGAYRVQGPVGTFIEGNNELALALVMTIPLMRYLHLQERNQLIKNALAGGMLLSAISAVGSQSRGALVGLVLMGAIFWTKSRNKLSTALLIAISIALIAGIMPDAWYARMNTIETYDRDDSALGRINAWWTAWNVAKDRATGGGFMMFQSSVFQQYAPEPGRIHDAHSIYFQVLGNHGFIGLLLFLLLLVLTWLSCGAIIRQAKKNPDLKWAQDLGAMVQVSLAGYLSAGAFLGLGYFDYIYHLIAVAVVVRHLVEVQKPAGVGPTASESPAVGPGTGTLLARQR
jgi:probable O-glycosylation ligase (exosortase A-associated)